VTKRLKFQYYKPIVAFQSAFAAPDPTIMPGTAKSERHLDVFDELTRRRRQ
jgi:hypothetical protein